MNFLNKIVDINNSESLAVKVRQENFKKFKDLVSSFGRKVKILDLGGRQAYWEMMKYIDPNLIDVTLVNLEDIQVSLSNFRAIKTDIFKLNNSEFINFDIIFAHSLIEHVDHEKLAKLIVDSGKPYFVQTPNKHFPIEPHFLIPLFQYFPLWLKLWCVRNFRKELEPEVESINLLTKKELERLFPNSSISGGKLFKLVQSYVVLQYEEKI